MIMIFDGGAEFACLNIQTFFVPRVERDKIQREDECISVCGGRGVYRETKQWKKNAKNFSPAHISRNEYIRQTSFITEFRFWYVFCFLYLRLCMWNYVCIHIKLIKSKLASCFSKSIQILCCVCVLVSVHCSYFFLFFDFVVVSRLKFFLYRHELLVFLFIVILQRSRQIYFYIYI